MSHVLDSTESHDLSFVLRLLRETAQTGLENVAPWRDLSGLSLLSLSWRTSLSSYLPSLVLTVNKIPFQVLK